ncbi:MAG: hypothetical protein OHK0046_36800 [Anaerolineae bacterium]
MMDWDALRKDLDWYDDHHESQVVRQLLQQRARQYATAYPTPEEAEAETVLAFQLGAERYGVDVMAVRGVRPAGKITPVPAIPRFYRGVVNVRGQVLTVLDLRVFFGIDTDDTPSELIVVEANRLRLGLLADRVEDVLPITDIELVDDMRYARGLTPDRLIVLNIAQLLADDRLIVGGVDE